MRYKILISYRTGDSFKSEDKESFLDGVWEDKDIIRINIERIKEHNDWYCSNHENYVRKRVLVVEPEWHKGKDEASVLFNTDEGVEYLQSAFWCGYFEALHGAKAVLEKETEIGFEY